MFKLSNNSKIRREGVDPRLIEMSDMALSISVVDFGHPADAGFRTPARQHELFTQGVTMCDGYKKLSRHQSGMALDFYAYVNGKASWETEHLAMVAAAFLQAASALGYKLAWGGLWKSFKDFPHVELVD
jgi:peptidoglycan L-alanyl-D-glutamate endopeptidase CwlK